MTTTPDSAPTVVTIRLDDATRLELEELARVNDRTLSAEVRRAIRRYLETNRAETAA